MARLNVPSVFIYGGSILPGSLNGEDIQIQNVFEAVGQFQTGKIDAGELLEIENNACPGSGSCGGMFTANTMSSIGEALGLSLPGSASEPNVDQRKAASSREAGHAVMNLLRKNIRPSDILTREAFENAVTVVVAMGGSTNTTLHLPAIAAEMGVELTLKDIHDISMKTPLIANMKPGGDYVMLDIDRLGGIPVVMKRLLDAGLLHGRKPRQCESPRAKQSSPLGRRTNFIHWRTRHSLRKPRTRRLRFESRRTPVWADIRRSCKSVRW
jgi:dihydroxy-acid dehydratase